MPIFVIDLPAYVRMRLKVLFIRRSILIGVILLIIVVLERIILLFFSVWIVFGMF